jgi:hypothetical protein
MEVFLPGKDWGPADRDWRRRQLQKNLLLRSNQERRKEVLSLGALRNLVVVEHLAALL